MAASEIVADEIEQILDIGVSSETTTIKRSHRHSAVRFYKVGDYVVTLWKQGDSYRARVRHIPQFTIDDAQVFFTNYRWTINSVVKTRQDFESVLEIVAFIYDAIDTHKERLNEEARTRQT